MKSIETLVEDIHEVLNSGDYEFKVEYSKDPSSDHTGLRFSNVGKPCERQLWYSIKQPDKAIALEPSARFKFLYGDIIESVVLDLARLAGHTVEGEQDKLTLNGVVGHRDAVIDGVLVDVKSASTYSFKKFKEHNLENDDPFGYITQLGLYLEASQDDPLVKVKDKAGFLAIDKQLGHICLDMYDYPELQYSVEIDKKKALLESDEPPIRRYMDVDDGKSGNKKLCTECSYCPFKDTCWPDLRTFIYSNGPRYLTNVERTPDVPEV